MTTFPFVEPDKGALLFGGNKTLYLTLLSRFCEDDSFIRFKQAFALGNVQSAFLYIHTLKGLAAQLALPALYHHASLLCERLRGAGPDALEACGKHAARLETVYRHTLAAIDSLLGQ